MKQFQAGFILDTIIDEFEKKSAQYIAFKKLIHWASYFQLSSKSGFENHEVNYSPILAVLINLMQRGLPTKLNKYALDYLVNRTKFLSFNQEDKSSITIRNELDKNTVKDLIFKSFHLIEPRFTIEKLKEKYNRSWEKLGSTYEEEFIFHDLPNSLGDAGGSIIQLLAPQRTISSIIKADSDTARLTHRIRDNFEGQRTDYSIEFPYHQESKSSGVVIEIDGPQHQLSEQQYLDTERDRAVTACGWSNTLRIKTSEFGTNQFIQKIKHLLVPVLSNEYIKLCVHNVLNPMWNDPLGKEIMQLCLIPIGVARIQRSLLELLASEILQPQKGNWKIAIIERDVPCGVLAIEDLQILLNVIDSLIYEPLLLPKIDLEVFSSPEFIDSQFQGTNVKPISSFNPSSDYDLVIDISILERAFGQEVIAANADEIITLRSSHYNESKRSIITNELIKFKPFCSKSISSVRLKNK